MRRIFIYIAITAALLAVPLERSDVADLHPVQTVALYKMPEGYRIETDTDDMGIGESVETAFRDLIDTTPGMIYLDTADFLLISQGAETAAEEIRRYLKNSVRVCGVIGEGDMKAVSEFLSVQTGLLPLHKWKKGQSLPVLDCRTERIKFLQKNVK